MSRKEKLSKESIVSFLKESGIDNKNNAITYYDIALGLSVHPRDNKEVSNMKKLCREAKEESLISIFVKDNISHLYAI